MVTPEIYFNVLWELPGVIRTGPIATVHTCKSNRGTTIWLAVGMAVFRIKARPSAKRSSGLTHVVLHRFVLVGLSTGKKSLYLTGKRGFCIPALTAADTKDVIAAGRDYFSKERSVEVRRAYDGAVIRRANELVAIRTQTFGASPRARSPASMCRS